MAEHHAAHAARQVATAGRAESVPLESSSAVTFSETDRPFSCSRLSLTNDSQASGKTRNTVKVEHRRPQKPTLRSLLACCFTAILVVLAAGAAAFAVAILDFYSFAKHGKPLRFTDIRFTQPLRIGSPAASEHLEIFLDGLQVRLEISNPLLLPLHAEIAEFSLFFRPSPKARSVAQTQVKRTESKTAQTAARTERGIHGTAPDEQPSSNRTKASPWAHYQTGLEATVAFVPSEAPGSTAEPTIFPPGLYRRRRLSTESVRSRHHDLFESVMNAQKQMHPVRQPRLSPQFPNPSSNEGAGHLPVQEGDGIPPEFWGMPSYIPGRQLHPSRVNGVAINRGAREVLAADTSHTGWEVHGWGSGDELLENPLLVQDMLDALSPGRSVMGIPNRGESGTGFQENLAPTQETATEQHSGRLAQTFGHPLSAPPASPHSVPFPSYLQFSNSTACVPEADAEVDASDVRLCPQWHDLGQVQQQSEARSDDVQVATVHSAIRSRSSIRLPLAILKRRLWHPRTESMTAALELMVACLNEGFAQFQLRTSAAQLTMAPGWFSVQLDAVQSEPLFIPCEYHQEIQLVSRNSATGTSGPGISL
ncbi:conserved hypothetical protein [Neospora caninum Liverpool]|uniref:Transmembrane protein n=1 Tax=Neospora caninum (strain Liverpool) TaxID=572307 RepID=F0VD42_NEOCL|nr:conserved hypothetical protein [Neospora caninum Liverpool]CBZ51557.1 conserved hypothetical protein [Neospora caninum Liverpool]CEL65508.1 TPA: hypothetical protein BN1204_013500 [Neospora caninum Liverpool]|eukprot:XP_003881590.1 conserved hypothetical protein [Neospora caninum Liverpool]